MCNLFKSVKQTPTTPLQSPTVAQVATFTPSAILTRLSDNGVETRGNLLINYGDKKFSCNTLELPWKDNQHDISCIPAGTYQCSLQPFHNTKMYELSPTAPRTGIFIHSGNYDTDVLGCILLGDSYSDINHDGQQDILNSRNTVTAMMDFVDNLPFTLHIVYSSVVSKI